MEPETSPKVSVEQAPKSGTVRFLSGASGSLITSLLVTPLDVVKVRQQTFIISHPVTVEPCSRNCGALVHSSLKAPALKQGARYTTFSNQAISTPNIPTMARQILQEEGISGLYAGIRPTILMSVPNAAIYYSAYESIRYRFVRDAHYVSPWVPMVSGSAARLVASTATAPLEYLKTAQASVADPSQRKGSLHMVQCALKRGGVGTLFQGLGPTLWRDVPFSAIYWVGIEYLRDWQANDNGTDRSPQQVLVTEFLNGAIAGLLAAASTTPFDVIKTRQQSAMSALRPGNRCDHDGAKVYRQKQGTFASLRAVAEQEGVSGLWRGNQARMLKVAPSCGIMIGTYECCKILFAAP